MYLWLQIVKMRILNTHSVLLLYFIAVQIKLALSQQLDSKPVLPVLPPNDNIVKASSIVFENQTEANPTDNVVNISSIVVKNQTEASSTDVTVRRDVVLIKANTKQSPMAKIYMMIKSTIRSVLDTPKVNSVMRNIGTCVVNGAVELITYYFPGPLIPIIASIAGMMVPFEPVVMLSDQMPVSTYRRAFMTALSSFLGKFDRYKFPSNNAYSQPNDPYMLQRFNRRMMSYGGKALNSNSTTPNTLTTPLAANKPGFLGAIDKLFKTLDRMRSHVGDSDTEDDLGRRFDWKSRAGCTNC